MRSSTPVYGKTAGLYTRREEEVTSWATAAAAAAATVPEVGVGRGPGRGEEVTTADILARHGRRAWFTDMRFRLPPRLAFETTESFLSKISSLMPPPDPRTKAGELEGQGPRNLSGDWLQASLIEVGFMCFGLGMGRSILWLAWSLLP